MSGTLPLFDAEPPPRVAPATPTPEWLDLARGLHERWQGRCRLGTSSWHFPGWQGWVWRDRPPAELLSRHGLGAYAQHPLLRTVSLDRAFYRLIEAREYAALAAQVPEDFRFVVKAPALLSDAQRRDPATGRPLADNPQFLDPALALQGCVRPAIEGLGPRMGVLVVQLSPLPRAWLDDADRLHAALDALGAAMAPPLRGRATLALELRDPELLGPELARLLQRHGMRPVLGVHDRLPPVQDQLPLHRACWPGDLVCRWNLQRGQRYAEARDAWAPFERLQAPDLDTRRSLARVARATLDAGHCATITINNKAEGSAPASVVALARELLDPSAA